MYHGIDSLHMAVAAEEKLGKNRFLQNAVAEHAVTDKLFQLLPKRRRRAHQFLGMGITVVDRNATFGQKPTDIGFPAAYSSCQCNNHRCSMR